MDGDKVPDRELENLYRHSPDAPHRFDRSSLIIGPRGVGKTMLLRYQRKVHPGAAVYLSLAADFGTITQESGKGPLGNDPPEGLSRLIAGKAVSLLATAITDKLRTEGVSPRHDLLRACLPPRLRFQVNSSLDETIGTLRAEVMAAPLEEFGGLDEAQALYQFVATLGAAAQKAHRGLLLLFDKADMVAGPALRPVLSLLDQTGEFLVLVAIRPGQSGYTLSRFFDTAIPGDHYDLVYLGLRPRSPTWLSFVEDALRAQLGPLFDDIPPFVRGYVITLARDSIRNALEVLARYLSVPESRREKELLGALEDYHHNLIGSAQVMLKRYGWDFRSFVKQVRKDVIARSDSVAGPIYVNVGTQQEANNLFHTPSMEFDSTLQVALRMGAISMPEGDRWNAALPITAFELPPIVAWQAGDPTWDITESRPSVEVSKTPREITAHGGGFRPTERSLFVAYRFDSPESCEFRSSIDRLVSAERDLYGWRVSDGILPYGAPDWARIIRERITKSKIMIADVTGLRREIMFELGVAFGARKPFMPVLSDVGESESLPSWLVRGQLGSYGQVAALEQIVQSILILLRNPREYAFMFPKQPTGGHVVWLRNPSDDDTMVERFVRSAEDESLLPEVLSPDGPVDHAIDRASAAGLLVVTLDGTRADALAHFLCGAIVAKPKIWGSFLRRVIVVEHEPDTAASNLHRCPGTIYVAKPSEIRRLVQEYGRKYKEAKKSKPSSRRVERRSRQ